MSNENKLTDRELLLICYGAVKALAVESSYSRNLLALQKILDDHFAPPPIVIGQSAPWLDLHTEIK